MTAWIRKYEQMRHNPDEINESWHSTKYPIEGLHWADLQQIYVDLVSSTKS